MKRKQKNSLVLSLLCVDCPFRKEIMKHTEKKSTTKIYEGDIICTPTYTLSVSASPLFIASNYVKIGYELFEIRKTWNDDEYVIIDGTKFYVKRPVWCKNYLVQA
jgi:hypothetical protein